MKNILKTFILKKYTNFMGMGGEIFYILIHK